MQVPHRIKYYKMKSLKTLLYLSVLITGLSACYYDVEEELYPSNSSSCDTSKLSFATNIYPIINSRCNTSGCHNNASSSAGLSFEGYANVKAAIDLPKFLGSIKHESSFSPMPKSSTKLSSCDILKIEQWKKNGSPNN